MNKRISLLLAGAAIVAAPLLAYAGGSLQTLPGVGASSYCASQVTGATGQICGQTVPAGPPAFTGNEVTNFDLSTPGTTSASPPQSAFVDIQQLGQGAVQVLTTVAAATMAPGSAFLFVDGADASAFTISLPASPIEGQFAEVACATVTVGAMTVAANAVPAGTVLLPAFTPAACAAGTSFKYRYSAALNTWFKV
jgi:hypothetical protein